MKFCVLTADEYREFWKTHPQASFMQSVELSELKKEYGSKVHFVGIKENDKVIAGSMILQDKTILGQSQFYAPRGLIVDYHNKELLAFFTESSICKERAGLSAIEDSALSKLSPTLPLHPATASSKTQTIIVVIKFITQLCIYSYCNIAILRHYP